MGNTISNESSPTAAASAAGPTGTTSIVSGEDDEPGSRRKHLNQYHHPKNTPTDRFSNVRPKNVESKHSTHRHSSSTINLQKSPVTDELLEDISSAVALSGGLIGLSLNGTTPSGSGPGSSSSNGTHAHAHVHAQSPSSTTKSHSKNMNNADYKKKHHHYDFVGSPYPEAKTKPVNVRKGSATTNVDLATASAFLSATSSSVSSYDGISSSTSSKDSSPSSKSSSSPSDSPSSSPALFSVDPMAVSPFSPRSGSGHGHGHGTLSAGSLDKPSAHNTLRAAAKSPSKSKLDVDTYIARLFALGAKQQQSYTKTFCMTPREIKQVCHAAYEAFMSQPVLLELGTPVKVVGDIHGQFTDLMRIFNMCGIPPKSNYLFLGDYVDRGKQSLETILLLLLLKIKYPENVFLLRGNHECANVTKVYGFYDECKRRLPAKAGIKCWKSLVDVFNALPIAAIIGGKIFCVHGGLSPDLKSLDDIRKIQRPTDIPDSGLLSDLLWSDPDATIYQWAESDRGVSFCFGKSIVDVFCKNFKFDLVARGHMVVEDGYEFFDHKRLVTIFSAPNYCGEFDNWGAVMSVNKDMLCSFDLLKPRPYGSNKAVANRAH